MVIKTCLIIKIKADKLLIYHTGTLPIGRIADDSITNAKLDNNSN